MAEIAAAGEKIFEEEVSYKSAVSEATFNKIGGSINYILENASDFVGNLVPTMLTEAQFATVKGYDYTETDLTIKKWVIVDGQTITGSDYAVLTGITSLPNAKGNQAFPRQSNSDANIGQYETSQNLAHTHGENLGISTGASSVPVYTDTNLAVGTEVYVSTGAALTGTLSSSTRVITDSAGSATAQPNCWKVNYFLKING